MDKRITLFCLPYAGGSASAYSQWGKYLDEQIQIKPLELAGRGKRIHEPHYATVNDAIQDIFEIVQKDIGQKAYAFFGHSMGAMLSYELARKIRADGSREPQHIFFSGKSSPHIKRPDAKKYAYLEEEVFKKEIINLGGTPPEFFEHPELMELFIPLLRNDFRIAETDFTDRKTELFNYDITIFAGKDDDLTPAQIDGWKEHTSGLCSIFHFNGGHFFLHEHAKSMINIINRTLLEIPVVHSN